MTDPKLLSRIGQKIRSCRNEARLTVQQLALRSNISKGLLSRIENGKTTPSLPVFLSVLESLQVSLKDFFGDMLLTNPKQFLHIKYTDRQTVIRQGRRGFHYTRILSHPMNSCVMDAVILTIGPDAVSIPVTGNGLEFKFVLSGQCDYIIGNERIALSEGDVLFFDASLPHVPINKSGLNAVILVLYFLVQSDGK